MAARKYQVSFWENVTILGVEDCWEWRGARLPKGYGVFAVAGQTSYAHRFAYLDSVGPIPGGMFVCHRCDRPSCVNPSHLFLGTAKDNVQDMWRKGRARVAPRVPDPERVCRFCGRSTLPAHSKRPRECGACERKAHRNGRCGRCGAPLSVWRGRVRTHICGERVKVGAPRGRTAPRAEGA